MKKILFSLLALTSLSAHAAIFDAADYLEPNHHAVGIFGEALLSNPTSSGMEGRFRAGISDGFNATGLIGFGSGNRGFRLGGEASYNLIPDTHNAVGVTGLAGIQYLHRLGYGSVQTKLAPLVNLKIDGLEGNPASIYFGLPLYFEIHQSTVTTSSQLAVGGNFDLSHHKDWYMITEGGISMSKSESYILLGFGLRFGSRFELPARDKNHNSSDADKEYRSEDFQK